MFTPDQPTLALLLATLQRFVAPDAQIVQVASQPLSGGMSGSAVARHAVQYASAAGAATVSLITKAADSHEWRALQHLQSQRQPNVPFAHSAGVAQGERLQICMQDLGDRTRPTSLDPISAAELAAEAEGLAAIHAANFVPHAQLGWLPAIDAGYIQDMLFVRAWQPAWQAALADERFVTVFGDEIPRVEAAAATIVADVRALLNEPESQTLIHADLNPSNVLVYGGRPYFIDWQTAMYGPFYIDLPHHHCTLEQAEHYRLALAARGRPIARGDFAERYRVAARYIGLRYMWWTLEYWREDPSQTAWVRHYFGLVLGAEGA